MAGTVYESRTNEPVLVELLTELHALLDARAVWGSHLGSETLMRGHKTTRTRYHHTVANLTRCIGRIACIAVVERRRSEAEAAGQAEQGGLLVSLPEECQREILCKLSDSRDLDSAGKPFTKPLRFLVIHFLVA